MKKIYQTPAIRVRNLKPTNIVCASFGSGNTDTMHGKESLLDLDDAAILNLEGSATIFPEEALNFDE